MTMLKKFVDVAAFLALAAVSSGCATLMPRDIPPRRLVDEAALAGMQDVRIWGDASAESLRRLARAEVPKMRALSEARARSGGSPDLNVLAISGGAEDGAFGAGLLVGWGDAGTRPQFDLVTGVSAGALIAPLVYLGRERERELKEIFTRYQKSDIYDASIMKPIFGSALVDSAPLESLIALYVDNRFLRDVARERRKGRILLIGTTNLDAQRPVLWDMGRIAMSGHPEALQLFRKVLLASASVPGAFPPVRIKVHAEGKIFEELHVDGGVTQQVFVSPPSVAVRDLDPAIRRLTRRVYIIRNGKVEPEWEPVQPGLFSISGRSFTTLIKNQGIGDLEPPRVCRRHIGLSQAAILAGSSSLA